MKQTVYRMVAIVVLLATLAGFVVPVCAAKLTDKDYAELFSPVYGPLGEYADPRLEEAFREDPLGFVKALAKEKYSNMFSVIDGRMGDWSSDLTKRDLRDALLQVAYGEKLSQPERRVVRWMLKCTNVLEDYPLFVGQIDYQELFSHILTGEHIALTEEILMAFDRDAGPFIKALAKESTRVKESVLLDLALEHYYLNPLRNIVKENMDHLTMYGDLNDAERQIITEFWAVVDYVTSGQSGIMPDFQDYENRTMLARGITLKKTEDIDAWREEAEDLFLSDPKRFVNALPWEYSDLYHTLRLLINTPWFTDSEKVFHKKALYKLTEEELPTDRRRAVKWMLMFSQDWNLYEAYKIALSAENYPSLIGQIQHTDVITADLLGEELYQAFLKDPNLFFNGLIHYTDYINEVSLLLVKASYEAQDSVGEISLKIGLMNDLLGWYQEKVEFRTAVEAHENRLRTVNDAPAYVPPVSTRPTNPTTESDPTTEPKADEPLNIPAVWIIVGVVAVIFGVQAVAVVLNKRKNRETDEDDEEFE